MSGLAAKVRRAAESDEFDLANYDQARCDELCKLSFSEPLPLGEMVRLSFVVGGGKLVRQKYSDDLPKMFMGALSTIGFKDDNSASVESGSGGKYKFQHDTGKNLKFVHVFPNISGPAASGAGAAEGDDGEAEADGDEASGPTSPLDVLFTCEADELPDYLAEQLPTYSQRKRLRDALKSRIASLEAIEAKMTRLEALTSEEQALFDGVGAEELREKVKVVEASLQELIDGAQLTVAEKAALLEQLEAKAEALEAELKKAEAEGKAKKAQALTQQREVLSKTRTAVKDSGTANLPALRHAGELRKLHGKLAELARIEKASKGKYSLEELKRLGERPEIEEAIGVLEGRSRLWLEDEAVFQERLKSALRGAGAPSKAAAKAGSSSGGGYGGARPPARAKAATGPATRNGFAALG